MGYGCEGEAGFAERHYGNDKCLFATGLTPRKSKVSLNPTTATVTIRPPLAAVRQLPLQLVDYCSGHPRSVRTVTQRDGAKTVNYNCPLNY